MAQISDLRLKSPLALSYFRNNRSSGQKSLRCFPQCTHTGHVTSGFCGDHLEFTATIEKRLDFDENWLSRISVIAEIRPLSDQGISSENKISRKRLLHELRDTRSTKIGGELLFGQIKVTHEDAHSAVVEIVFNEERHSWDYSWKSNRWSGVNVPHVVDVIIIQNILCAPRSAGGIKIPGSDGLEIYSNACSPTFLILSSHKSSQNKRKVSLEDTAVTNTSMLMCTVPLPHKRIEQSMQRASTLSSSPMRLSPFNCNSTAGDRTEGSFSCVCHRLAPSICVCPSASLTSWGSTLPPKRQRLKCGKIMEVDDDFYDSEMDSSLKNFPIEGVSACSGTKEDEKRMELQGEMILTSNVCCRSSNTATSSSLGSVDSSDDGTPYESTWTDSSVLDEKYTKYDLAARQNDRERALGGRTFFDGYDANECIRLPYVTGHSETASRYESILAT